MDQGKLLADAARAARAAAWEYVRLDDQPAERRWRFYATPELRSLMGYTTKVLGSDPNQWVNQMHPDDIAEFTAQVGRCLQGMSDRLDVIFRVKNADGQLMTVRASGCLERELDGRARRLYGLTWDVTKFFAARERSDLIARVFDAAAGGLVICDPSQRVIEANKTFHQITGWPEGTVKGRSLDRIVFGEAGAEIAKTAWASVRSRGAWIGQTSATRKDGRPYQAEVRISSILSSAGETTHYAGLIFDLDALSAFGSISGARPIQSHGVMGAEDLHRLLGAAINEAATVRTGLTILVLGIDRLSSMFETYGRRHVDQLLIACEDVFRRSLADTAIVAHVSGDRFVIAVPDLMEEQEVSLIFSRLQSALRTDIRIEGKTFVLSASAGAAVFPLDGSTSELLLQRAENALEDAARFGKRGNHLELYSAKVSDHASDRLHLENSLRNALKHGSFECHLQPKVALESGRWVGAEALMRWRIGDTWISPGRFIPIAEESGLIKDMGRWILWEAASKVAQWRRDKLISAGFRVAVNLAGAQLEPELIRTVRAVLSYNQLPSDALMLELTETIIISDPKRAHSLLEELRKIGVRVALDDFGTGFTSMSQLLTLPVDELKIDQSFVRGLPSDEVSAAIIRSVISLAQGLKLDVIAEGIETEAQRACLVELGCHYGQGYLFDKALTPVKFEEGLKAGKAMQ